MADEAVDIETADDSEKRAPRSLHVTLRLGTALWIAAVVAALSLVAGLGYFVWWPDRQTDDAAAQSAMSSAADGMVALLTMSSDTFDRDVSNARSHLTSDFMTQYDQIIRDRAPQAKQKGIKATATVVGKAISELRADSAVVLLFINQSTVVPTDPAPLMSSSQVKVNLSKVDGKWLISAYGPVT